MAKVPPTAGTGAAAGNPGRPTSLAVGGSSAGRPSFGGLRGDEGLRRGTFASLALACAALGYAEYSLLPEVGWFAAVVVVALAVIYRREGRVALLSIPDANRLGAGIAVLCAGWAAVRVIREYNRPEFTGLGWPLFFVCLCGMLILAVIPAKLLRRDKHAGDYWQLYLAGLGAAVLAGAMADDVFGFALLGAYAAAGVWALAEFHAARAAGRVPPVPSPGLPAVAPVVVRSAGGAPLPLSQPLVWAAVAVAAAGPLYLVTPRSEAGKLDFAKERVEIGFAADQMVDLTRTGDLKANPEEAFAVRVTDSAGRPVDDLDPGQRWRGVVLTHYRAGGWSRDDHLSLPPVQRTARNVRPWQPPDLGPDQLRVAFSVPTRLRAEFLADPVHWLANEPVPVADVTPGGPAGWYVLPDGSFVRPPGERPDGTTLEYVQYTRRTAEPEVGPGFHPAGPPDRVFVTNPVGRVKDYADGVVRAGVAAGRLPAALDRLPAALPPPAEFHEAIAREFARHLSEHPELRYTTAVRRGNREVDPVEDFLFFTKAGHCERFASALVLMLRSQAIPSVLVLGFKGCESAGDGRYVVRQEFAHAWAEAMVVRPAPPGVRATRQWHWLTLDPSPASTAEPADQAGADGLLGRVRTLGRETVGKYLVNYTRERRDEALRAVWDFVRHPATVAGAAGLVGLGIAGWAVWRVARRRRAARADGVNRLAPLYAALAGMGYRPNPGDTPLEFARTATAGLRGRGLTEADDVAVPVEWVEGYYRDRFGGEPGDEARAGLDARLAGLRDALRAKSGVPT